MVDDSLNVAPLHAADFDSWRVELESRWVSFRSQSGRVTEEEAAAAVTRIVDGRLPDGLATADQFVLTIKDVDRIKGFFWLEIKGSKGFLYDVVLNENVEMEVLRSLIEKEAIARGASELRIIVYEGDEVAKNLSSPDTYMTIGSHMWLLDDLSESVRDGRSGLIVRPMKREEFPEYFRGQTDSYASEKVAAGKCTPEEAILESEEEMAKLLPDGLDSENHYIFVAELQNEKVGTVWVVIDREVQVPRAFGLDIEIEPSLRGQGLGRDLMYATQVECRKLGAKGFALSVFGHNSIARNLYESFGFKVTEEVKKRILTD